MLIMSQTSRNSQAGLCERLFYNCSFWELLCKYKPFLGAVWENEANSNLKQTALEKAIDTRKPPIIGH